MAQGVTAPAWAQLCHLSTVGRGRATHIFVHDLEQNKHFEKQNKPAPQPPGPRGHYSALSGEPSPLLPPGTSDLGLGG